MDEKEVIMDVKVKGRSRRKRKESNVKESVIKEPMVISAPIPAPKPAPKQAPIILVPKKKVVNV